MKKMKKSTSRLLTCLTSAIISTATPALAEVYECTFEKGHVAKPTPTRVVMEIDDHWREGRLLEIEIPGVVTSPGPITVKRNNNKVVFVEWMNPNYEFTAQARQNGARSGGGVIHNVDWRSHLFSVFLKKDSLKAHARSRATSWGVLRLEQRGSCVRLK